MKISEDAQRHLRALVRLIGEDPNTITSVTFNLKVGTALVAPRKRVGGGLEDTSKKGGVLTTEATGVKTGAGTEDGTGE